MAGDVLEWAQAQTAAIVDEYGGLEVFARHLDRERQRVTLAQRRADVLWREGGMRLHEAYGMADAMTSLEEIA